MQPLCRWRRHVRVREAGACGGSRVRTGCCRACSAVKRLVWSTSSRWPMKSLAVSEMSFHGNAGKYSLTVRASSACSERRHTKSSSQPRPGCRSAEPRASQQNLRARPVPSACTGTSLPIARSRSPPDSTGPPGTRTPPARRSCAPTPRIVSARRWKSHVRPPGPACRTHSGALYPGLPQIVVSRPSFVKSTASPKSLRTQSPAGPGAPPLRGGVRYRTFSGLRSRWMIPRPWM